MRARERANIPEKCINPIVLQNEVTSYLHWSLLLCFILENDRFRQWYYQHFIQLGSFLYSHVGSSITKIMVDYLEHVEDTFRNSILLKHCIILGYDDLDKNDLNDILCYKLCQGYFGVVYLDEYFLPGKRSYQKHHFVHPTLFYGFDSLRHRFMCIGYDSQYILVKYELDFDTVREAFISGAAHYKKGAVYAEKEVVQLYLPNKQGTPYIFDNRTFFSELTDYVFSRSNNEKLYLFQHCNTLEYRGIHQQNVGLSVTDEVLLKLQEKMLGVDSIDYVAVHILAEHKRGIYNRLKYIYSQSGIPDKLGGEIDKYEKLVHQLEVARMLFLRETLTDKGSQLHKIVHILESTRKTEEEVLIKIINSYHERH